MSYTDILSGATVGATNDSSSTIDVNASNIVLNWPSDSNNVTNPMTYLLYFNVAQAAKTIRMPNATLASNGARSIFINNGPEDIEVADFDGGLIFNLIASETMEIALYDNSSEAGEWKTFSNPAGGSVVTSVAATPPARGITIAGSPITGGGGTFIFDLSNTLASLETIGTGIGVGFFVKTAVDGTLILRSLEGSDTNIQITNPEGTDDNPIISLNTDLTALTSIDVGDLTLSSDTIQSSNDTLNILAVDGIVTNASYYIRDQITNFVSGLYLSDSSLAANINYHLPTIASPFANSIMQATPSAGKSLMNPSKYSTIGAAAAWIEFDATGILLPTLNASLNIATFVRNGTGSFTITTILPFANLFIGPLGNCNLADGSASGFMAFQVVNSNTINIFTRSAVSSGPANYAYNFAAFYGTLA